MVTITAMVTVSASTSTSTNALGSLLFREAAATPL